MTREQRAILNLADNVIKLADVAGRKLEELTAHTRELEKRILVLEGGGIVKSSPETAAVEEKK